MIRDAIRLPIAFLAHEGGFSVFTDHVAADQHAAAIEEDGAVKVQAVLLHDLFHHAALGLDYDLRGELLTAHLDRMYPWYSNNTRFINDEIRLSKAQLPPGERPSRWEIARLRKTARRRLGYVRPRAYLKPLKRALADFVARGPIPAKATLVVVPGARRAYLKPR